jgi:hypothetical protein
MGFFLILLARNGCVGFKLHGDTNNHPTLLFMKAWAREKDGGDMLCASPEDTVKTDADDL